MFVFVGALVGARGWWLSWTLGFLQALGLGLSVKATQHMFLYNGEVLVQLWVTQSLLEMLSYFDAGAKLTWWYHACE